jgi:hypothetical protein
LAKVRHEGSPEVVQLPGAIFADLLIARFTELLPETGAAPSPFYLVVCSTRSSAAGARRNNVTSRLEDRYSQR